MFDDHGSRVTAEGSPRVYNDQSPGNYYQDIEPAKTLSY